MFSAIYCIQSVTRIYLLRHLVRWLATLSFASGHFAVFWSHYILYGAECVCHKNNGQKCVHCHKQCLTILKICTIFFRCEMCPFLLRLPRFPHIKEHMPTIKLELAFQLGCNNSSILFSPRNFECQQFFTDSQVLPMVSIPHLHVF